MQKAFITGVAGLTLSEPERRLIGEARPAGLILFARNIETASQVRALIAAFKDAAGTDEMMVLVDQEGGRVQRLKPPIASRLPPAAAYLAQAGGNVARAAETAWLVARLLADELTALGFNTDCAPVLDVPVLGAHDIIGNRAFAHEPAAVIRLGRAFAEGLMAGGIIPVMKHIPGHGRAFADSHIELPVVDASRDALVASDLAPFVALKDLPAAMTAHVVYKALDPAAPASTSRRATETIIRGHCGFDGLLMSDDLGMKALSGPFGDRARAVLDAGSDLALHCSGVLVEMIEVAAATRELSSRSLERFDAALAVCARPRIPYDEVAARVVLDGLVAAGV